ncbi:3-isopropylmalate dehydratase small subunit [Virgibacillus ihumii]|uniref:3-isopropylmalate dehydratase small subunit n=1 Tax=Virgibacillus ihumii TaxID=2686091 RepID=UPI00157C9799|nr:3-isopropylmalate dehydratase small subunit [Virgibacillus ihumii]
MKPFKKYSGSVVPINKSDIDTDIIIPTEFLKRTERTGFGKHLMYYWRYDDSGAIHEDFELNQSQYNDASILLAGSNFGCGSSRENAVWALYDYGFRVVVAPSFADIFQNNSSKNGLLLIELDELEMDSLFDREKNHPGFSLEVDLKSQVLKDQTGWSLPFSIDPYVRMKFLEGLDDIDLTLQAENQINEFEKQRPFYLNPIK